MKPTTLLIMAVCFVSARIGAQTTRLTRAEPTNASLHGSGSLAFTADGRNGFTFDTGVLRGRLRADGKSRGLTSVVHVPTGQLVDRSHGLVNHYRVFTTRTRYGPGLRDAPSEARLRPDGSVEVHWPANKERPFELRGIYRWTAPNTLDVETIARAKTNLPTFEVFVASYFQSGFTNSLVYAAISPTNELRGFVAAERSLGGWLMFPRDATVIPMIQDGRWMLPPNPIAWVMRQPFRRPLGVRRDPSTGVTALLMSSPKDCFAVSTPHETEGHYSTYLSLFGRDLEAGETATARLRLVIDGRLSGADLVAAHEAYLKESLH